MDPKLSNVFDAMELTEAHRLNQAKTEGATILQVDLIRTKTELSKVRDELRQAKDQLENYEYLLRKPISEIARLNADFRKSYEDAMLNFVGWMASEKGFIELAVQLGADKGLSRTEIMKLGRERKMDVLHNRNPQGNFTNASEVGFMASRTSAYLERWEKQEREFKQQYETAVSEGRMYHILDEMESNWDQTYKAWLPLALAGSREAQFNVGRALEIGVGVGQDKSQATDWFEKAIAQNEPRSAYLLFLRFREKKSNEFNIEKARNFGKLAIELGDTRAPEAFQKFEDEIASDDRKKLETQLWNQAVRVSLTTDKSDLVKRISGKGYAWEHFAIALLTADYKFDTEKFYEKGAFFASSKKTYLCVTIKNNTLAPLRINPQGFDYFERSKSHDYEIAPQQARKYKLALLSKGERIECFEVDNPNDGRSFFIPIPMEVKV